MKTFLAVFTGNPSAMAAWHELPEEERRLREARGMEEWHAWAARHASSIVQAGGPLGRTRRVDLNGVSDVRNNLAAFVIVGADSQEAAASMFVGHPHFTCFPGDGVEVMEVLPVPAR